jgi:hypothetical protein
VREQTVKHSDATTWRQSGLRRQLWTIATTLVTVFVVTLNGTKETVKKLLGVPKGILVSDGVPLLSCEKRPVLQVCHLWLSEHRLFLLCNYGR